MEFVKPHEMIVPQGVGPMSKTGLYENSTMDIEIDGNNITVDIPITNFVLMTPESIKNLNDLALYKLKKEGKSTNPFNFPTQDLANAIDIDHPDEFNDPEYYEKLVTFETVFAPEFCNGLPNLLNISDHNLPTPGSSDRNFYCAEMMGQLYCQKNSESNTNLDPIPGRNYYSTLDKCHEDCGK